MIYIAPKLLQEKITSEWKSMAQEAHNALLAADSSSTDPDERKKARKKTIDDYQQVWKELKTKMSEVNRKCWYCETWETRADTAVDHYRPKSAVKECPDHPGYWWLAFSWENYRYSCQFCNEKRVDQDTGITGGKGTCFPLVREENRVYEPGGELQREEPFLLDPTNETDVLALSFEVDGTAQPRWKSEDYPVLYNRARKSITLYHLNKQELKERRQTIVCAEVQTLIAQGDKYFARISNNDQSAREAFNETIERLRNLVSLKAEYSAAAKAIISFYRDHPWVDAFVCSGMM